MMRLSYAVCKRAALLSLCLVGALLTTHQAQADDVIVSNLTAPFQDNQGALSSTSWIANSFTSTATTDVTKLSLFLYGTGSTASLYSDNTGTPGIDLGDFAPAGSSVDAFDHGIYDFTPSTPVSIQANTNYWVVAKGDPGGAYWDFTNDTTPNIGGGSFTFNAGAGWVGDTPYSFKFEVDGVTPNATATPEPGTYALLVTGGLTGFTFLRRKRARK